MAVHRLQQPVGAALHRQMQVLAQFRLSGNGIKSLWLASLGWLVMNRMW